jgi:hypothetical protein
MSQIAKPLDHLQHCYWSRWKHGFQDLSWLCYWPRWKDGCQDNMDATTKPGSHVSILTNNKATGKIMVFKPLDRLHQIVSAIFPS